MVEPDDPRKKMTGRQIIESTKALNQSCLPKKNNEQFMNCWLSTEEHLFSEMK